MTHKRGNGFTLVELIIVLAILAILAVIAAIAAPSMIAAAKTQTILTNIRVMEDVLRTESGLQNAALITESGVSWTSQTIDRRNLPPVTGSSLFKLDPSIARSVALSSGYSIDDFAADSELNVYYLPGVEGAGSGGGGGSEDGGDGSTHDRDYTKLSDGTIITVNKQWDELRQEIANESKNLGYGMILKDESGTFVTFENQSFTKKDIEGKTLAEISQEKNGLLKIDTDAKVLTEADYTVNGNSIRWNAGSYPARGTVLHYNGHVYISLYAVGEWAVLPGKSQWLQIA